MGSASVDMKKASLTTSAEPRRKALSTTHKLQAAFIWMSEEVSLSTLCRDGLAGVKGLEAHSWRGARR